MLFQSPRALYLAPGRPGSIWKSLEALVRSTGMSGRFACGFQADLYFADEGYLSTRSITASKLAPSWPLRLHNHGLHVHLQTRSITILEGISKFTRSHCPSVSPNTLDHHLQVHLRTRKSMPSEYIYEFT